MQLRVSSQHCDFNDNLDVIRNAPYAADVSADEKQSCSMSRKMAEIVDIAQIVSTQEEGLP